MGRKRHPTGAMTPADVSSDASQSLLYHLTNSYQTSMSAAHPPHRANKRAREESTDDSPKRLFIGRACCPPFVFALGEGMTATNREWLRSGSVNEMDYDAETRQFFSAQARDDNTHGGSASKGSRASSQSDLSDGWSRRQEVFLWKAQLRYGEGKEWEKVVKIVNKADPDSKPHTLWECQEKWAEVRRENLAL